MTFYVFPLKPGTKEPAVKDWENVAVPEEFAPGDHYGIACGPSGLVVVDCDVDKISGDKVGLRNFLILWERHESTVEPETLTVETPSGGTHYYFAAPEGENIRNSAGKLGKGIDTRAAGGYVVGPGVVLPNGAYEVSPFAPETIADLPQWLCAALRRTETAEVRKMDLDLRFGASYAEKALESEIRAVLDTMEGGRNHQLNQSAYNLGQLVGGGLLDPARAKGMLEAAGRAVGLQEREIVLTVASGLRSGFRNPRVPK